MKCGIFVIFSLVLLDCICADEWDFFVFSRAWPYTFCTVNACKNTQLLSSNLFTIHGLWPNGNNGSEPAYCHSGNKFDVKELQPIIEQLNKTWIDSKNPAVMATSFWKSEYEKHGTCAASDPNYATLLQYFSAAAITLFPKIDVFQVFKVAGLVPGSSYEHADFQKAMLNAAGALPDIVCADKNGRQYIQEVRLCYNKSLVIRDCLHHGKKLSKTLYYDSQIDRDQHFGSTLSVTETCSEEKPVFYPDSIQD